MRFTNGVVVAAVETSNVTVSPKCGAVVEVGAAAGAPADRTIGGLIDDEDKIDPLSDQRIAELLHEQGLQIARRTVAKYREQLQILPARLRRRVA